MKLTDLVPPAWPTRRHPVDSAGDRQVRWRLALEAAWQRKIDEAIALSTALCDLTSDDEGGQAGPRTQVPGRLQARTERAYDELAAIEDAIARIDDGTYGACDGCDQAMSDDWLTGQPEVRYCPDCCLRRVSSQRPRPARCPS
jgi:RNA polymerase-binding transcription factor DksA